MEARRNRSILTSRLLLGLLVALVGAFLAASPAVADDTEDDSYTPSGMGSLFSTPDLKQGQAPTLYEQYPESVYSFDFVDGGLLDFGIVDYNLNTFANTIFTSTRILANAAITLTWQVQSFDGFGEFSPALSNSVGAAGEAFTGWLLPSTLAIGALAVLIKIRGNTGEAINQVLLVGLSGIAALSLATHPDAWLAGMQTAQRVGVASAGQAIALAPTTTTSPFEGPTPTFTDDAQTTGMRVMGDSIWRTFVVTPWCLAEFGTQSACQQWGPELLARNEAERGTYITQTIKDSIGGDKSSAYTIVSGHNGAYRLGVATMSLLVAAVFCLVIIALNLIVVANVISALIMLILGGFFSAMWAIPGAPRGWANRWFSLLVGFVAMTFLSLLVLAAALAVTNIAILLNTRLGWMSSVLIALVAIIAAFAAIGHIRAIFGASSTGVGRTFGGAVGLAMMTKSLVSGFGRGGRRRASRRRADRDTASPQDSAGGPETGGRPSPSGPSGGHGPKRILAVSNRRRPGPHRVTPDYGHQSPGTADHPRSVGEARSPYAGSTRSASPRRHSGVRMRSPETPLVVERSTQERREPRHAAVEETLVNRQVRRAPARPSAQAPRRRSSGRGALGSAHLRANPPKRRRSM